MTRRHPEESELEQAAKRAAAELRHAWRGARRVNGSNWVQIDGFLVTRAIEILEKATTPREK